MKGVFLSEGDVGYWRGYRINAKSLYFNEIECKKENTEGALNPLFEIWM
jgi:hypothetical protein